MEKALKDEGLDEEQWEQMQRFEQASNMMEERYLGPKDWLTFWRVSERVTGFTEGT